MGFESSRILAKSEAKQIIHMENKPKVAKIEWI